MAVSMLKTLRDARLNALNTAIGSTARIKIYDNSAGVPVTVDAPVLGTLLVTLTGNSAGFSTGASLQTLTASEITAGTAGNSGTAAYARICNSGGTAQCQCLVTVDGGGGDITLTGTVLITAGLPVNITSLVITEGNL